MRSFILSVLAIISSVCFSFTVTHHANDLSRMEFATYFQTMELEMEVIFDNGIRFERLHVAGAQHVGSVGSPELVQVTKWVAVDPDKEYRVVLGKTQSLKMHNIVLYPVQEDGVEGEVIPFKIKIREYLRNLWQGEVVSLGEKVQLGPLTLLPVRISPVQYNPVRKTLRIYTHTQFSLVSESNDADNLVARSRPLTAFQQAQVQSLVLNSQQVVANVRSTATKSLLILTPQSLLDQANELGAFHVSRDVKVQVQVVPSGSTSFDVKKIISKEYDRSLLQAVLLFGDENKIPLHNYDSVPSDSYYSFLQGSDYVADIAIGRLPVSDSKEADHLVEKTLRYYAIQENGHVSKKIMLIAHKEQYPGKYTANQEEIKKASNPKYFEYTSVYGGAGKKNKDIIDNAADGYAITNYRGHGSATAWTSWASDSGSFGEGQIYAMQNYGENMTVFINIACTNGAIQNSFDTLVESELFTEGAREFMGGVAAIGATIPTYTTVNHSYDKHLFKYFSKESDISLGNINALANNNLVKDSPSSTTIRNVKSYILFADPLLAPWLD